MPAKDFWDYPITQGYGPTTTSEDSPYMGYPHFNKGLDFGAPQGTIVRALVGGSVVATGMGNEGWGVRVWIRDANRNTHNYGHLSRADVAQGATVSAGDPIGLSGNTGHSTGPHVSYDVWDVNGQFFDPSPFVWPSTPAEKGPNGRTIGEISGKPYLSVREQAWFLEKIGRSDLITAEMVTAQTQELAQAGLPPNPPPPPPEEAGPNGRTARQITGTEYLSFREQVWYLGKMGRDDVITAQMRQAATAEG